MNKQQILMCAIEMVQKDGLINLSRTGLCDALKIPNGSFRHFAGCTFSEFVKELQEMEIESPYKKVFKSRTIPELRKSHILSTAVDLACAHGYDKITRAHVAKAACVSEALISQYFSMDQLRAAIIKRAIVELRLEILAAAVCNKRPEVLDLGEAVKLQVIQHICK